MDQPKKTISVGMHYATMTALIISNLCTLGLAMLFSAAYGQGIGFATWQIEDGGLNAHAAQKIVFKVSQPAVVNPYIITTIDNGVAGVEMEAAPDGLPIFVYQQHPQDLTSNSLMFAKCLNVACTDTTKVRLAEESIMFNFFQIDIAVGSANKPVIFVKTAPDSNLPLHAMIYCSDSQCTSHRAYALPPISISDYSDSVSLAVDSAGLPILAYLDSTAEKIRIIRCTNTNCSNYMLNDLMPQSGSYSAPSLTLAPTNMPIVSYYDGDTQDIMIAFCGNVSCGSLASSNKTKTTFKAVVNDVTTANWNIQPSLALASLSPTSTYPVISFNAPDTTALTAPHHMKVAHCTDSQCSAVIIKILDDSWFTGVHNRLALGKNNVPAVVYMDATTTTDGVFIAIPQDMRTAVCATPYCSNIPPAQANTVLTTAPPAQTVMPRGIEIGLDNNPLIAYMQFEEVNYVQTVYFKVLKCNTSNCSSNGQE